MEGKEICFELSPLKSLNNLDSNKKSANLSTDEEEVLSKNMNYWHSVLFSSIQEQIKHQEQFKCCYQNWMAQQQLDLHELVQAQALTHDSTHHQLITKKIINHFENYHTARAQLAKHDAPAFLAPKWGSTFENSLLWIGGCRPSLFIRLLYSLSGSQLTAHMAAEFLEGVSRHENQLGDISSSQLKSMDALHSTTVREEDKLNSRLASLQAMIGVTRDLIKHITKLYLPDVEMIADEPLALLAIDYSELVNSSDHVEVVDRAMDTHALDLYYVMVEADKLRLDILKGMVDILTPLQAVELLVASKKVELSVHEWSKKRDIQMGITHFLNKN